MEPYFSIRIDWTLFSTILLWLDWSKSQPFILYLNKIIVCQVYIMIISFDRNTTRAVLVVLRSYGSHRVHYTRNGSNLKYLYRNNFTRFSGKSCRIKSELMIIVIKWFRFDIETIMLEFHFTVHCVTSGHLLLENWVLSCGFLAILYTVLLE